MTLSFFPPSHNQYPLKSFTAKSLKASSGPKVMLIKHDSVSFQGFGRNKKDLRLHPQFIEGQTLYDQMDDPATLLKSLQKMTTTNDIKPIAVALREMDPCLSKMDSTKLENFAQVLTSPSLDSTIKQDIAWQITNKEALIPPDTLKFLAMQIEDIDHDYGRNFSRFLELREAVLEESKIDFTPEEAKPKGFKKLISGIMNNDKALKIPERVLDNYGFVERHISKPEAQKAYFKEVLQKDSPYGFETSSHVLATYAPQALSSDYLAAMLDFMPLRKTKTFLESTIKEFGYVSRRENLYGPSMLVCLSTKTTDPEVKKAIQKAVYVDLQTSYFKTLAFSDAINHYLPPEKGMDVLSNLCKNVPTWNLKDIVENICAHKPEVIDFSNPKTIDFIETLQDYKLYEFINIYKKTPTGQSDLLYYASSVDSKPEVAQKIFELVDDMPFVRGKPVN